MMHEDMIEQIAEGRGYDKGQSAARSHDHELLNDLISQLKDRRCVVEAEGITTGVRRIQAQIDILEQAKYIIRSGVKGNAADIY